MSLESDEAPRPIDIYVGARIRLCRTLLGTSQGQLGELLGLTFRQIQRYEHGMDRVGASHLFCLSQILHVPIGFFFGDVPTSLMIDPGANSSGTSLDRHDWFADRFSSLSEMLKLILAYYRIADSLLRLRILDLIKSMAPTESGACKPVEFVPAWIGSWLTR
jgi:transcriptional regulator with XRE-family HTH domain